MTTVGITGHQNLPPAAMTFVEAGIRDALAAVDRPFAGLASLAVGADQLFATIVLDLNGSLDVIVPCAGYERTFGDPEHLATYRELLTRSRTVERLPYPEPAEEAFMAAGVRVVDRCDVLLAVWDGRPAAGLGGTADIVRHAWHVHRPVTVIWPSGVFR